MKHKMADSRAASHFCTKRLLLVDGDDDAGTHGTAALTDGETQAVLDGDGGDQLHVHVHVIAGMHISTPSGREMTPVTSVVRK